MIVNNFATGLEISLGSQQLFTVAGFPVTNSLLTGAVSLVLLLAVFGYVVSMVKRGKYNRFVGLIQWAFEGMLGQVDSVIPDKKLARKIAPLALTIFFYMLFSYWMSVLPGLEWLLAQTGRTTGEIDVVGVSVGPGSFTGLRIGLSVAKALAYASGGPWLAWARLKRWPCAPRAGPRPWCAPCWTHATVRCMGGCTR